MGLDFMDADLKIGLMIGGPAQVQSHKEKKSRHFYSQKIGVQISNFSSGAPA